LTLFEDQLQEACTGRICRHALCSSYYCADRSAAVSELCKPRSISLLVLLLLSPSGRTGRVYGINNLIYDSCYLLIDLRSVRCIRSSSAVSMQDFVQETKFYSSPPISVSSSFHSLHTLAPLLHILAHFLLISPSFPFSSLPSLFPFSAFPWSSGGRAPVHRRRAGSVTSVKNKMHLFWSFWRRTFRSPVYIYFWLNLYVEFVSAEPAL